MRALAKHPRDEEEIDQASSSADGLLTAVDMANLEAESLDHSATLNEFIIRNVVMCSFQKTGLARSVARTLWELVNLMGSPLNGCKTAF